MILTHAIAFSGHSICYNEGLDRMKAVINDYDYLSLNLGLIIFMFYFKIELCV